MKKSALLVLMGLSLLGLHQLFYGGVTEGMPDEDQAHNRSAWELNVFWQDESRNQATGWNSKHNFSLSLRLN